MKVAILVLTTAFLGASTSAASWEYKWQQTPAEQLPQIEISPLKYGKTWAYAIELDDQPATTATVVQPLLARFSTTDAPPGVSGGQERPFVGTAAIFLSRFDAGNSTFLDTAQVKALKATGWGLINHSYWHTGNHWDASKALKPADLRRELFWSQALWPHLLGNGRATTQFVYPNGDYNFGPYLKEFGLRSGSRVGGKISRLPDDAAQWVDLDRNWLDENVWSKSGDALEGLPKEGPLPGDVIVDFTHGINADAESPNHKRWQTRLEHLAGRYGKAGNDSMWCAPTEEIVAYNLASKAAKVSLKSGQVNVELPDELPGTALTLHFSGLAPHAKLTAPPGGTLYRKGDEAWLTTPVIGQPGVEAPTPKLERIYQGVVKNVSLEKPRRIAGVRLQQNGAPKAGFLLDISAIGPTGTTAIVPADKATLSSNWGLWNLFPTVPDREAPLATQITVTPDPSLKLMEIWALRE